MKRTLYHGYSSNNLSTKEVSQMKRLFSLLLLVLLCLSGCSGPAAPAESSEPAEVETTADPAVGTADAKPQWYLTSELERTITYPEVPAEYAGYSVKLPVVYEAVAKGGLSVKIEFFQETYPLGSLIQARISVTNTTEAELQYWWNTDRIAYFEKSNAPHGTCLTATPLGSVPPEMYVEMILTKPIAVDETAVFEYIFIADPSFFVGGDCHFLFALTLEGDAPDLLISVPVEPVSDQS